MIVDVSYSQTKNGSSNANRVVKQFFKRTPNRTVRTIHSGLFTVSSMIAGCKKPGCYSYSLEDAELKAAFPEE